MATIRRGSLTISVNIILTASLITKAFSFGFIMMAIYIKVGDDILENDVIKVVNMQEISGMPLGTTLKAIVFSLIGVFVLELLTGIVGIWGAFGRRKQMLAITVLLRSLMIVIYSIYIFVLAVLYNEKSKLRGTLMNYIHAYEAGSSYISSTYLYYTFPNFLSKLGCDGEQPGIYFCPAIYNEQLSSYLQIYFGLIVTCIICQCFIIVAVEYTYRKLEFKEKKPKITDNKYYLLFSLKHGIFKNLLMSAKDTWQRSKSAFLSVILKITSIMVGGSLLGLGLTLMGDNFIYDSSLKYIFYQIQFYNYYFYDILVGLAASIVVFGILAMVISIIGIVGSWRKSSAFLITSSVLSTILHVPRLISLIVFSVLIQKIKDDMKDQLYIQQNGYYYNNTQNKLTENWNNMIMKCCGVFWFSDTSFGGIYEYQFCCKNAHESRMDAGSYYTTSSNNLDYFGSCGGYKRDTCTGKIVFKTKMFIGWFLGIVSVQIIIEIIGFLFANKEYSLITSMDIHETKGSADQDQAPNSKTILLRKIFGGIQQFFIISWKRNVLFGRMSDPKTSLLHFILYGIVLICNIGTLGLAIYVRYDSVFENIDIQALLSEFIIADQTVTRALNMFSIVVVTFSSASILLLIYTVCSMASPKWKRLLMFINVGLWCFMTVANLVQIGLWKEFMSQADTDIEHRISINYVNSHYTYMFSHASGHYDRETSLSWNTLFVKAKCCGVSTEVFALFGTSNWRYQADSNSQYIPVQCCKSQIEVYPYGSEYDFNCTHSLLSGYYHDQGCDTEIINRLESYSVPFFVFISIAITAQIGIIATTIFYEFIMTTRDNAIGAKVDTSSENIELKELKESEESQQN